MPAGDGLSVKPHRAAPCISREENMSDKEVVQTHYEKFYSLVLHNRISIGRHYWRNYFLLPSSGVSQNTAFVWLGLGWLPSLILAMIVFRCNVVAVGTRNSICRGNNLVDGSLTGSPQTRRLESKFFASTLVSACCMQD